MRYCKPHAKIVPESGCRACEARVIAAAERLPLRVTEPQAWPRCHRCWSLAPVCRCAVPLLGGSRQGVVR